MISHRTGWVAFTVTFAGVMMVFAHGEMQDGILLFGFSYVAASFLDFGLYVSTMSPFTGCLFSRLGDVCRTFGQILALFLLFMNDFFVMRYISWIGHDSL